MTTFLNAKKFIYRNARPLELALWQYHFENGRKEAVLDALSYYQNEDGGFGHGIEADLWNVNSSPLATSNAVQVLREIDFYDPDHEMVKGILNYLEHTPFQEARGWYLKVPTNNDYPHSVWWEYTEESKIGFDGKWAYNPTAILAGFILKTAEKNLALYQRAERITAEAIEKIVRNGNVEMHEADCFCTLYEFMRASDIDKTSIDMDVLEKYLRAAVSGAIEKDASKWTGYCAKPSQYISGRESIFYPDHKEAADYECEYIVKNQRSDGSWPVTWEWWTGYKEFEVAANWWKSRIIINNMLYLKGMGKLG